MRLVLASTSPARLQLLRAAGIEPLVIPPSVDEEAWEERERGKNPSLSPDDLVLGLAKAKAESVVRLPEASGALVLGADSTLDFGGASLGKPLFAEAAVERWRLISGGRGRLLTGHYLIDNLTSEAEPLGEGAVAEAAVEFAQLDEAEIARYVATGEPLSVAGGFTLNGIGAPYVASVSGDAPAVIGLSLFRLRLLVQRLGHDYQALWS